MAGAPVDVLVVDDDKSVRDVLSRALVHKGFTVTAASSAQEAMDQLQRKRFGLMLLDVRMPPGANGIDVLPKALDLDPDLRVIMLTAVSDLTTAARCMQLGAREFLTKPIDLSALTGAIEKTLAG